MEIALVIVCLLFFALHVWFYKPKMDELGRIKKHQERKSKVELRHQGATCLYFPPHWDKEKDGGSFNYNLYSWDAGKNWYAVEYDEKIEGPLWGLRIVGDARQLYPGLLEHIEGIDNLTNYVTKNGPLDISNPNSIKMLNDAGFKVANCPN